MPSGCGDEELKQARREGRVQIRRRNGELFVLQPATVNRSPLDVPAVPAKLRSGELPRWIREGRDRIPSRRDGRTRRMPRG